MFVKHVIDEDIFEAGFTLNPILNESFYREKVDTTYISTYMHIWLSLNSYRYKVITDREGEVERGNISSVATLNALSEKYFENDIKNFISRQIHQKFPHLNTVERSYFNNVLKKVDLMSTENAKDTMLSLFGENYVY